MENPDKKRKVDYSRDFIKSVEKGDIDELKNILDISDNRDQLIKYGIYIAASRGNLKSLEFLLTLPESDPNYKDMIFQTTPLMMVINRRIPEKYITLLLQHPLIDVNATNRNGETALMLATSANNLPVVELLLKDRRSRINQEDLDGKTAFEKCKSASCKSLIMKHVFQAYRKKFGRPK